MFIANDSNYTFGQFLAVVDGDDIKAPVYSKCFTDTEALKGYRFIHDPEETDPEKCVCFSIYDDVSSKATSTAFGKDAVVSDLTSVSFRLDTKILDSGKVRDVSYYHVIVPVQNIKDDTLKYLVIKMTKEVELFPENYPYYELVSTFADAEPTSAEAPGSVTPTGTITITENDTYDVTNYASAVVNVSDDLYEPLYELNYPQTTLIGEYVEQLGHYAAQATLGSVPAAVVQEITAGISYDETYDYTIYMKGDGKGEQYSNSSVLVDNGAATITVDPNNDIILFAESEAPFTITVPAATFTIYYASEELADLYPKLLTSK